LKDALKCGGPSKGTCDTYKGCTCKDGFIGENCENKQEACAKQPKGK